MNDADTYDLRLNVAYEGSEYAIQDSLDFTVTVVDPCLDADLTIGSGILSSVNIVYSLYSPVDSQTLLLSYVTSSSAIAACPIELAITDLNGSVFDTDVFTFNPSTNVFTIESHDITKIDDYDLKITAKYTGSKYTKTAELQFKVTIDDHCAQATLTIDPSIIAVNPIIYQIGYPADF